MTHAALSVGLGVSSPGKRQGCGAGARGGCRRRFASDSIRVPCRRVSAAGRAPAGKRDRDQLQKLLALDAPAHLRLGNRQSPAPALLQESLLW